MLKSPYLLGSKDAFFGFVAEKPQTRNGILGQHIRYWHVAGLPLWHECPLSGGAADIGQPLFTALGF
jgi:hypothetical protein